MYATGDALAYILDVLPMMNIYAPDGPLLKGVYSVGKAPRQYPDPQ